LGGGFLTEIKMSSRLALSLFKSSFSIQKINTKDLVVKHSRASGKGGQNVNKVNTKVEIRLAYGRVDWIPQEVSLLLQNTPFTQLSRSW
jgi:peptidyl-tRNA hydrolase ICT1